MLTLQLMYFDPTYRSEMKDNFIQAASRENVYSGSIYNYPKLQTMSMSFNGWMNKQAKVHI